MVWSAAAVSANELTYKSGAYPALIPNNILERSSVEAQWRVSGSWASGSDITSSAGPARLSYDRRAKVQTLADIDSLAGNAVVSLIYDVSASSIAAASFDCVAILGHNFNAVTKLSGVFIDISDVSAFTNLNAGGGDVNRSFTIKSWSSATDWGTTDTLRPIRLFANILTDPETIGASARFASVRYVRVRFTFSSNIATSDAIPKIGEVWLGRRRQLAMHGQLSFTDRPFKAESADFKTESGDMIRHSLYQGAGDTEVTFNTGGANLLYDMETELREWQHQISYGQKSFLYIEDMSTAETDRRVWAMMQDPPTFQLQQLGPFEKEVTIGMVELPPYVSAEV